MRALQHYGLCLLVALPVAIVGIVSAEVLHTVMVWPGCAVSAFLGTSTAVGFAYRAGLRERGGR